jgi:hypothetical protein
MINGFIYDFEAIKLMLPTGYTLLAASIAYSDWDYVIASGSNKEFLNSRYRKNNTCEIELERDEFDKFNQFASTSRGFYNIPPIKVIVSCHNFENILVTDSILVHFTKYYVYNTAIIEGIIIEHNEN